MSASSLAVCSVHHSIQSDRRARSHGRGDDTTVAGHPFSLVTCKSRIPRGQNRQMPYTCTNSQSGIPLASYPFSNVSIPVCAPMCAQTQSRAVHTHTRSLATPVTLPYHSCLFPIQSHRREFMTSAPRMVSRLALGPAFLLIARIVHSPFGQVLKGIKEWKLPEECSEQWKAYKPA